MHCISVRRPFCGWRAPALLILLTAAGILAPAQTSAPRRTVWDGSYTEAQATRGTMSFAQSCAGCHSLGADGRAPLGGDSFWKSFSQKSVGEMRDYIATYMPNGTPGSLSDATYNDIVAFILKSNGFPAGTTELTRSTAADLQIIPRDGHTELNANTLVRVVGCLSKSGTEWMVTRATTPERAERAASPEEEAGKPLGSRTMTLKFVLTKLDSLAGSRVAVNGLLIGTDGIDGINVTTVNRVAPKCP